MSKAESNQSSNCIFCPSNLCLKVNIDFLIFFYGEQFSLSNAGLLRKASLPVFYAIWIIFYGHSNSSRFSMRLFIKAESNCSKSQDLHVFVHSWIRKWKSLLQKSSVMSWLVVTELISIADERILGGTDYIFQFIGASSPKTITLLSIQKLLGVI